MGLFDDLPDAAPPAAPSAAAVSGIPTPAGVPRMTVTPGDSSGGPPLDDISRELLTRTVLGEAAGEPHEGKAGVAAVIKNRLASGKFGASPADVVLAKNQFEPWSTPEGRGRMMSYAKDSPEYGDASAAVDRVFGDEGYDPTAGATHFYAPKTQAALGRAAPKWAQGEPVVIGGHNFYAPNGAVTRATPDATQPPVNAPASPPNAPNPSENAQGPGAAPSGGLFDDLPSAAPAATATDGAPAVPTATATGPAPRLAREGMSPPTPDTAEDVAKSGGIGLVKGTIGLAGLPGDLSEYGARGLDVATRYIGNKLGVDIPERPNQPNRGGAGDIQKAVEGVTGPLYEPKTTAGQYAQTVGEFAPAVIGGPETIGAKMLSRVVAPAVASEAAGQATKGTALEPYARVAAAAAGGFAPSVLGRAVTPLPATAARQRLVDTLTNEGVTSLTAGQRTGSPALRYAESALGDAPLAGGQTTRITDEGRRQFTDAALRRAGTGGEASPEVLAENNQRLGRQFEDLSARNTLQMDPQFTQDIGAAVRTYDRVPPSQQKAIVEGYFQDIVDHAQNTGTMPGAQYQEMRSRLSRQANGLRQSDPTLSETLRDMRDALDSAMARSISPQDRVLWRDSRREYAAQKTIEKAASKAGEPTAEGQIVPANLRNVVATGNNRGAYARGEGDFSELARAGSGVMGSMPQSGTGPRVAMHTMASGVGALLGAAGGPAGAGLGAVAASVAGPAVAGRALMSRPAQAYLGNQVAAPLLRQLNPRQSALLNAIIGAEQQRLAPPK